MGALAKKALVTDKDPGTGSGRPYCQIRSLTLPEHPCRSPVAEAEVVIDLPSPLCAYHRRHGFCFSAN